MLINKRCKILRIHFFISFKSARNLVPRAHASFGQRQDMADQRTRGLWERDWSAHLYRDLLLQSPWQRFLPGSSFTPFSLRAWTEAFVSSSILFPGAMLFMGSRALI